MRGQLLIIEGPDGTGKTTLARGIAHGTGATMRRYGPPQTWHRTWHDAWGLDLLEDARHGRVIHDRGIFGHAIWHQIMPGDNERLLVPAYGLGDIVAEVEARWRLRVIILMRSRRGIRDELRARDGEHDDAVDRALASIEPYYALHRTLTDLGVDAQVHASGAALATAPERWWAGW